MSRKVTQLKAHAGGYNPHHLDSRAEKSYSTRARWALRAIRKYVLLGLAPAGPYEILHARARAIFCSARESPVICIYHCSSKQRFDNGTHMTYESGFMNMTRFSSI